MIWQYQPAGWCEAWCADTGLGIWLWVRRDTRRVAGGIESRHSGSSMTIVTASPSTDVAIVQWQLITAIAELARAISLPKEVQV